MKARASIGRAAAELGVSIDALREYEERGLITPERTPGGHRRYRLEDLAQLKRQRHAGRPTPPPAVRRPSIDAAGRPPRQAPPIDDGLIEDVQTPEANPPRHPRATDWLATQQRNNERAADENHLRMLRSHGEYRLPWGVAPSARSAVIEMLASYVTVARFPRSGALWDAYRAIEAKVAATLEPFLEAAAAAKEQAKQAERRKSLTDRGTRRAQSATLSWHPDDRREAEAAVADILADEVEDDWREDEVDDLVDEILDEWSEDDEA